MEGFDNITFFKWILTRIKPLLLVQVIALVLSIVFSSQYFMPKEYKSFTVVYPYNMSEFSHESPSEQMIEFLNSVDIKNKVIEKFDLRNHYEIPNNGKPYLEKLYGEYDHNVSVQPTEFGAVEIKVFDISPDTAFEMVNSILDVLNKKVRNVQKEKSLEVANMIKMAMDVRKHQLDSMEALSKELSTKYGLLEYESQSRELSRAYYQNVTSGRGSKVDEISQEMKNMQEHGIEFRSVNTNIESALGDYNSLVGKYNDAMKDVNKNLTYWNLVSAPYKPDSYTYPIRSLIILGTCFAAFVFSIVVIRVLEKIKPDPTNTDRMAQPGGQ